MIEYNVILLLFKLINIALNDSTIADENTALNYLFRSWRGRMAAAQGEHLVAWIHHPSVQGHLLGGGG